jgi:hypothetical protein
VLFTIGTAPVINDLDNFSEVSLDRDGNSEVGSGPFYSNPLAELDSYANLQNLQDAPTLDLNSNAQQQHFDQNVDVNTNPITALGSAASMVFSTFSNIMKGSQSQSRVDETQNQPIPPPSMPPLIGEDLNTNNNPYVGNYGLPPVQPSDPNAPPPTFFTPGEENLFKKTEIEQPSNTFRLGNNKKKTYAHIPGLSSSQQFQNVPQNFSLNPVMPPMPPQPITHVDSMANFQPPAPINPYQNQPQQSFTDVSPEKSSSKFSLSSLLDKIPVTKNLFGSSNDENNYQQQQPTEYDQQYGYQDFTVTSQNYFQPQSNENQPSINFFNQQPQNYSFSSAQQSSESDVKHAMSSSPSPAATENTTPVNFFNPQQFNTTPFAPKVQPLENQTKDLGQANVAPMITHVPLTNVQGPFVGMQQPEPFLPPQTISPALPLNVQEPPKMETSFGFSPVGQAVFQPPMNSFTPQSFSTPPPTQSTTTVDSTASVSFFNPSEASELFKSRAGDDGKPKNPYSNTRARGVGLYKPRSSLTSESTSAQVLLPPVPIPSTQMNAQQFFVATPPTQELTRPSSVPIEEQKQNASLSPPVMPVESTSTIANDLIPSQPIYDSQVAQKKSDLNVPENENVVEQFQVHPTAAATEQPVVSETSNVSNFFESETSTSKINEQVSAINFFQAPETSQQQQQPVANFPPPQPLDSVNEIQNPINFFSMGGKDKGEIQSFEQQVRIIFKFFVKICKVILYSSLSNIIKGAATI